MKVSVGFSGTSQAHVALDGARIADELGLDGVWLTDQKLCRDAYVLLGACSSVVGQAELAVGVSDPYSRHPAELAAASATLSELTGGRFSLGLGAGGAGLPELGLARQSPLGTVAAAVTVIRRLWQGEAVTLDCPHFALREAQLKNLPRTPIPIIVVAHGARMYQLAGRLADKAAVANYATPPGIDWARAQVRRGEETRPDDLGPVEAVLRLDCAVAASANVDDARSTLRRRVAGFLASGYYGSSFLAPMGLERVAETQDPSPAELDLVLDSVAVAGTPDMVSDKVTRLLATGDWAEVCLSLYLADGQGPTEAVRLLSEAAGIIRERSKARVGGEE